MIKDTVCNKWNITFGYTNYSFNNFSKLISIYLLIMGSIYYLFIISFHNLFAKKKNFFFNILLMMFLLFLSFNSMSIYAINESNSSNSSNSSINSLNQLIQSNLVYSNGSILPYLKYDWLINNSNNTNTTFRSQVNTSDIIYTSYSYKDNSIINPNAFLKICTKNRSLLLNHFIDLAYSSVNCNVTIPLLTLPIKINSLVNNCTTVDIDLASYKAFYPGKLVLLVGNSSHFEPYYVNETITYSKNITNSSTNTTQTINLTKIVWHFVKPMYRCYNISQYLNGSFRIRISVDDIDKTTSFILSNVFDQDKREIPIVKKSIIFDFLNNKNTTIDDKIIQPHEKVKVNYSLKGGESLYLNRIQTLKIIPFNPCGVINKTGYYFINNSRWNANRSCIVIKNVSNLVLNFANKTIDGDNSSSGSLSNNSCAVIIQNSSNVTLIDLRAEQYETGLCIFNSSFVSVVGTYGISNLNGIHVSNSNGVKISDLRLFDSNDEIVTKNSTADFSRILVKTANFSLNSKDVLVKSVDHPPHDPVGLVNISQWLLVNHTSSDSWAIMKFYYHIPLPHNVLGLTVFVYRYDFNNITNKSTWTVVPTTANMIEKYFLTSNVTNFSTFVPLGEKINITPPKPVPTPIPNPSNGNSNGNNNGNSNGNGGSPKQPPSPTPIESNKTNIKMYPPKLKLTLINKTLKLQQGQTGYANFNLTNIGNFTVVNAIVQANVSRGWKTAPVYFKKILVHQTKNGKLFIKVYDNEIPGTYLVKVRAIVRGNETVDLKTLKVIVVARQKLAKMDILEVAPAVDFYENSNVNFPMLIKNTGDYNLTNITLSFESADNCIKSVNGSYDLLIGEKKSVIYKLKTGKALSTCYAVLILKSKEGAIAFSPIEIRIIPPIFHGFKIFFILFAIINLLTLYVIYDKIKQYIKIKKKRKSHKS